MNSKKNSADLSSVSVTAFVSESASESDSTRIHFKVYFGQDDIRRFSQQSNHINFPELLRWICESYTQLYIGASSSILTPSSELENQGENKKRYQLFLKDKQHDDTAHSNSTTQVLLFYTDDEGDYIRIDSQAELDEALHWLTQQHTTPNTHPTLSCLNLHLIPAQNNTHEKDNQNNAISSLEHQKQQLCHNQQQIKQKHSQRISFYSLLSANQSLSLLSLNEILPLFFPSIADSVPTSAFPSPAQHDVAFHLPLYPNPHPPHPPYPPHPPHHTHHHSHPPLSPHPLFSFHSFPFRVPPRVTRLCSNISPNTMSILTYTWSTLCQDYQQMMAFVVRIPLLWIKTKAFFQHVVPQGTVTRPPPWTKLSKIDIDEFITAFKEVLQNQVDQDTQNWIHSQGAVISNSISPFGDASETDSTSKDPQKFLAQTQRQTQNQNQTQAKTQAPQSAHSTATHSNLNASNLRSCYQQGALKSHNINNIVDAIAALINEKAVWKALEWLVYGPRWWNTLNMEKTKFNMNGTKYFKHDQHHQNLQQQQQQCQKAHILIDDSTAGTSSVICNNSSSREASQDIRFLTHHGVACSLCKSDPIRNFFIRCTVCLQFNVCRKCFLDLRIADTKMSTLSVTHIHVSPEFRKLIEIHAHPNQPADKPQSFRKILYAWESCPIYDGNLVPSNPLTRGDSSVRVLHLQYLLIRLNYMHPSDIRFHAGFFGTRTEKALIKLQSAFNITHQVTLPGAYDKVTAQLLLEKVRSSLGMVLD